MFPIREKRVIANGVTKTVVEAPAIARKRLPGQFVIIRLYEGGERIPLTIADADPEAGTITLLSQRAGKSTAYLEDMPISEGILDVVGPLGHPTHMTNHGHVVCIGGGIGIAPVFPIAQGFKHAGNRVTVIIGARSKDLLILEDELRAIVDDLQVVTDDGSYGTKGLVTDILERMVASGETVNQAVAIGPVPMMHAVADLTKKLGIPILVSLNALMVDGTGMCGACRVTVGGETKFTCVDGPEFDGHQVDFMELRHRLAMFREMDARAQRQYAAENPNPRCIKGEGRS